MLDRWNRHSMPSFPSDATTEAQLRKTQKRLELSLKSANLGTWTYRVATDDFWADDRALILQGHAPGEAKTLAEAGMNIHPDDYEQSQATFTAALQTRSNLQMEYRVIWRDDSVHWIASYAELVPVDGGTFYGVVQDITEVKRKEIEQLQTETALRESEERFRLFVTASSGVVYRMSADWREMCYLDGKQFLIHTEDPSRSWIETYIPQDDRSKIWAEIENAIQTKRIFELEHRVIQQDGTIGWTFSRAIPMLNDQGEILEWFGTASDVSDRKRTELQLRRAAEMDAFRLKLSDALRSLTDSVQIQAEACRLLGEQLGVDRVYYVEIHETEGYARVNQHYSRGDSPSIVGEYRLENYGWSLPIMRRGETIIIADTQTTPIIPDAERAAMAMINMIGFAAVPLIKRETLVGALTVNEPLPREWSETEIELIRETAERIWATIERARAEAELSKSEAEYRSLFTTMDQGFCIIEKIETTPDQPSDFRYLTVNPAFERHTGMREVIGKTIRDFVPNVEQRIIDIYDEVAQTRQPQQFEEHVSDLDLWIEADVFAAQMPGQIAVLFSNVSERKRAEAQLRHAAEVDAFRIELSDALRSLTDSVEIEGAACRLLGKYLQTDRTYYGKIDDDQNLVIVKRDYVRGDAQSLAGHHPLEHWKALVEGLRNGQPLICNDLETTEAIPDSQKVNYEAVSVRSFVTVPLFKGDELVVVMAVTHGAPREWTSFEVALVEETAERIWSTIERERAEAALNESELQRVREQSEREQERQRAETLAELDRAKTLFFSNVSHEFRTPLTLLLAPLQEVLNDRTLSPAHQERLELAHRSSLRLLKLVNTLLDFSRIEAGRMEAVYEPIDLAQLTTELASVFRSAIERAGLRLVVDCSPLPEAVYVDREMWEKIILNLLSNAFKFTFIGEITVRLQSENHHATIQIEDTGTGIAPEHLPHLFERFYQVRGAEARTHEGSGIGLALVHELVRLQGGTIEVTSTVGVGTCFTIALPFGTDHLPSERIESDRTLASTAMNAMSYVEEAERWLSIENAEELNTSAIAARVLLVDDNADMRSYLTRILSEYVQVEAVADGMTALRVAQAQVPDLILSDVMMPELDGFGLLQALRSDPRTREIPIILLSARAGEEAIVEGLEAGADDYLIKPFSAQELVSRVNAHLQMAQLRTTALQEARSTIRNRDELLSTVSHELNTPLVSILGWTRLLRSNPPSPSILTKALDTIERNATVQAALVQDLLDMSRITAGKLRLNLQPVELKSIVEIAIATVAQSAEAKSIDLIWQPDQDALVRGDRNRLQQVFSNMLTNAIKFTPAGGRVTVELSTRLDRGEIRVIDTGIGIASDFLPHVFDRFRQARTSDAAKGLGVGLAIARHLVELHHGTIRAESAGEGQGATFIISLPLLTAITNESATDS
mgnify:CR=1 FL=1